VRLSYDDVPNFARFVVTGDTAARQAKASDNAQFTAAVHETYATRSNNKHLR
jgi:hypothetical protein